MHPVLAGLRLQRQTAPADLGSAVRRANRGLLVLIPHQRPPECLAPEVPDVPRSLARNLGKEAAAGEEAGARLDDAELVALGVGEHHMALLRALANVHGPRAEPSPGPSAASQ